MLEPILENGKLILTGVGILLEVVLRLKPSNKNWSLIDNSLRLINKIVPNRKNDGDRFKVK